MRKLKPEERLIVAADFKPTEDQLHYGNGAGQRWARDEVMKLAQSLKGTGVYLKVNSVLRACGYDLIYDIRSCGLKVFADLKLFDIGETLSTDGTFLRETKPELLTVDCAAGVMGLMALKGAMHETEILGVTVLTSIDEELCKKMYFEHNINEMVLSLAHQAYFAGLGGLICSPKEIALLRNESKFDHLSLNAPAIRPAWAQITGDDQNLKRSMTPADAIKAGANRIVVGRPITQARSPYDAVMRTIDEIAASAT